MILSLGSVIPLISLAAVAMMAAAGVLEAGRKRYDLFGMVVVALAASLGGGSLRDLLLNRPVFWVADQTYLIAALTAALAIFFLARIFKPPMRVFLIADAAALGVDAALAALAAGGAVFLLRLIAIRWRVGLPRFASRESGDGRK